MKTIFSRKKFEEEEKREGVCAAVLCFVTQFVVSSRDGIAFFALLVCRVTSLPPCHQGSHNTEDGVQNFRQSRMIIVLESVLRTFVTRFFLWIWQFSNFQSLPAFVPPDFTETASSYRARLQFQGRSRESTVGDTACYAAHEMTIRRPSVVQKGFCRRRCQSARARCVFGRGTKFEGL